MSKSPRTAGAPGSKSKASLDRAQRAWIDQVLSLLQGGQPAGANSGDAAIQNVLSNTLGSQHVAQSGSMPHIPSPADVARQREGKREKNEQTPPVGEAEPLPATTFAQSKSAVQDNDIRIGSDAPYDKLPDDIKSKMSLDVWHKIGNQKSTLIQTYMRLHEYGLWDCVVRVVGIQEKLPPHGTIGPFKIAVHGTGGIAYEAKNAEAFKKRLIGTRHFGKDNKIMALMHAGQTGMRESRDDHPPKPIPSVDNSIHEWDEADKSFTATSLHISVGPGNQFDAHIDQISPVNPPLEGHSVPNLIKASKHISREVIAAKFGGFAPYISIEENKEKGWHGAEGKVTIEGHWKWDFPSGKKEGTKLPPKQPEPAPSDEKVQERIAKRVERTKNYFKIPVGTRPAEVPEPKAVATKMSAKMLEAADKKNNTIFMDLPFYLGKKEDHPSALDMMQEIGKIVRSELGSKVEGVTRLTVTFGSNKQGGTVSIAD
jgi:hypothetical protein